MVHALSEQVEDMPVQHLDGEAALRHHVLQALVYDTPVGPVGENHLETELGEERVPERILLVKDQGSRDAYTLRLRVIRPFI